MSINKEGIIVKCFYCNLDVTRQIGIKKAVCTGCQRLRMYRHKENSFCYCGLRKLSFARRCRECHEKHLKRFYT